MQVADCGVWQHCHCVGIPPGTDMPAAFMCELCRLDRCDPFWFPTSKALIAPTLLRHVPSRPPVTLLGPREACQRVDKTLELPSATARLVQQQPHKYRLQVRCPHLDALTAVLHILPFALCVVIERMLCFLAVMCMPDQQQPHKYRPQVLQLLCFAISLLCH